MADDRRLPTQWLFAHARKQCVVSLASCFPRFPAVETAIPRIEEKPSQ